MIKKEEFNKIDLRIGKILKAEEVKNSENLLKLEVDFKEFKKVAVSGIKKWYKPKDLIGKKFLFITNIEKRKIFGIESECMILAAQKGENLCLLIPEKDIEEGSKIS